MGPLHKRQRYAATLDNLAAVNAWLEPLLLESHLSHASRYHLTLIVEELFVNIAKYAYPKTAGEVEIDYHYDLNHCVELTFSDWGVPFNPFKDVRCIPIPPEEIPNVEPGGLGIPFICGLSDETAYVRNGDMNRVTIRKFS